MTTKAREIRDYVRCNGHTIEYLIVRSDRRKKTISIVVNESKITVSAPRFMATKDLRRVVIKRSAWILRHQKTRTKDPLQFLNGKLVPYLGSDLVLTVEQKHKTALETHVAEGRLWTRVPAGLSEDERGEHARLNLLKWYYMRATEFLPGTVHQWWKKIGYGSSPRILIRNQQRRWGSCAIDGTIRLNWRLIMLDQLLIDYIVVHELSHLKIRNHSPSFWNLVAESIPDFSRRRRHLKALEKTLPL